MQAKNIKRVISGFVLCTPLLIKSMDDNEIQMKLVTSDKAEITVNQQEIALSAVLQTQLNFNSSHVDSKQFQLADIDKESAERFVKLLKLIVLQGNNPIIIDMQLAYYTTTPNDQSVIINRILEKLTLQELLQLLRISSLLQLTTQFNQVICHYVVEQLGSPKVMQLCLSSRGFLEDILTVLPEEMVSILREKLCSKRGYLLWGCLSKLGRFSNNRLQNYDDQSLGKGELERDYDTAGVYSIKSTKNGKILGTFSPRGYMHRHAVFGNECALIETYSQGDQCYFSIYDIATNKCITTVKAPIDKASFCDNLKENVVSDNKLNIVYTLTNPDLIKVCEIESVVRHLSFEQIYFLILAEHAYLNDLSLPLKSVAKLQSLYNDLDREIQENHFDIRYQNIMQKGNRGYCIIS